LIRLLPAFLLLAFSAQAADVIPVLAYHRFDPVQSRSATVVTTAAFTEQLDWLASHHIAVVKLSEALSVAHGTAPHGPEVAITADDGWRSVYTIMFPIIRARGIPVTLFINPPQIGQGGAYLTWDMLGEMVRSGLVDVQPHTQSHPNFNTERARRAPDAFGAYLDREIAGSRVPITAQLGLPADILAWPFGIHDATLEQAAARAGFKAAFALGSAAVSPGSPDYALPRYQVYESDRGQRFGWIAEGRPRMTPKKAAP
jgi:peptidoglycan/xylan/chitin deacetylase (PgdA/CDA1 family)